MNVIKQFRWLWWCNGKKRVYHTRMPVSIVRYKASAPTVHGVVALGMHAFSSLPPPPPLALLFSTRKLRDGLTRAECNALYASRHVAGVSGLRPSRSQYLPSYHRSPTATCFGSAPSFGLPKSSRRTRFGNAALTMYL